MAALGGLFGLLALMVACLGIFGATAFQVARRTNEIGVRRALDSTQGRIVVLVLRDVAAMFAAGCLLGVGVALAVTGLPRKILFEVRPAEPGVFVFAAAVLGAASFVAAMATGATRIAR